MNRLIDDFKNRISSYDKEYEFSQEEVLNILERYEIKYGNVKAIPIDKIKKAREEIDDLDRHFDNDYFSSNNDSMFKRSEVLEILDKLIAESEG